MHTSRLMAAALCFFAWAGGAAAAENAPEASAILKSTEIRGGLCLMIGAETLSPAASLARESGLYI